MERKSPAFNNHHYSLKPISCYHSYEDIVLEQTQTTSNNEINILKNYYINMLDPKSTHILSNVKKKDDFQEIDKFNDDLYRTFITDLLMKLQSKENYSNFEIIEDHQFQKVLNIILGTNFSKNQHLMDVFKKDSNFILKKLIIALLSEIKYYAEYNYRQRVLVDNTNIVGVVQCNQWIPTTNYSNMLVNSNYKNITRDVFLNPDLSETREKQKKMFLDGFGYMVTLNGVSKLPILIYSSSCDCKDNYIITMGGLTTFSNDIDDSLLTDIYVSEEHDILPPYFKKTIMSNPNYIPNNYLYKVNTVTSTVNKLEGKGDVPLNLLKPTLTRLNSKYIFISGGIQMNRRVLSFDEGSDKLYLKQEYNYNSNCYILDTTNGYYTLINQQDAPNNTNLPSIIGHSQVLLKDKALIHFESGYLNYLKKQNTTNTTNESTVNNEKLSMQNFLDDSYEDENYIDSYRQSSDSSAVFDDEDNLDDTKFERKLIKWNILLFGGYHYDAQGHDISLSNDMFLLTIHSLRNNKVRGANVSQFTPTMFVKRIDMHERLTKMVPSPTAFHSSTLLTPGVLDPKDNKPYGKTGRKLDQLINTFESNRAKFDLYFNAVKNQDIKANKLFLNDIRISLLEDNSNHSSHNAMSFMMLIHGGYKDRQGYHDQFLFFNFKKFEWEEKKVQAPLKQDIERPLIRQKSKYVDIHLRIANHRFILKGEYIICVGGKLDLTKEKDYIRMVSKKIPVTVIHLPTMTIKDVIGRRPEQESLRPKSYMIGYDGDVIQSSNGELYICSGVGHVVFNKQDVANNHQVLLQNKNLEEGEYYYDLMGVLGVNMVYILPTFTNL